MEQRQLIESRGHYRVNWKRTFQKATPVIREQDAVYLELLGKHHVQTGHDPLLRIFYSLLHEFREFDPTIQIPSSIELWPTRQFEKIKEKAPRFLRATRSFYYSDKFRHLHSLLMVYFELTIGRHSSHRFEYLVTDNFQTVFESMVDALISDEELLRSYKYLKDGKEIDHLFDERDLFHMDRIIYIGDSKYYQDPVSIRGQKYKQFTYTRNIVQENISVFNMGGRTVYSHNYLDPVSEGYNVTPNFFIYATASPTLFPQPQLFKRDISLSESQYHFLNRLFDRDTLHILYFQVDFIRLIDFYGKHRVTGRLHKERVRSDARTLIHDSVTEYFEDHYDFYIISLSSRYIYSNMKMLLGKLYHPPSQEKGKYVLALNKNKSFEQENAALLEEIRRQGFDPNKVSLASLKVC